MEKTLDINFRKVGLRKVEQRPHSYSWKSKQAGVWARFDSSDLPKTQSKAPA